jgi:lipoyl(octanoyl) transferase
MDRCIETIRYGEPIDYARAMTAQMERQRAVEAGTLGNALFLLEHRPVITLGRSAHREHVLLSDEELSARGIDLVEANRGGDVTYHGPGQLVAYPILNLGLWQRSIRWYLRSLEEVLIDLLDSYGIQAGRQEGFTGVWLDGAKVAAIGIGIHNWVTFHGIALNVDPDMSHFQTIIPCGIADKPVTSLAALLGSPPAMAEVMDRFEQVFAEHFSSSAPSQDST